MAKNLLENDAFLKNLLPKDEIKLFGREDYFKYANKRGYAGILTDEMHDKKRNCNVAIYGLSKGLSAEQLVNLPEDEKTALGKEYLDFYNENIRPGLVAHPDDINFQENVTRMMSCYGDMYGKASRKLLDEKIPPYERGRMHKLSDETKDRFETLNCLSYYLAEKMEGLNSDLSDIHMPHFSNENILSYTYNFGSRKEAVKAEEDLRVSAHFINFMQAEMDAGGNKDEFNHNNIGFDMDTQSKYIIEHARYFKEVKKSDVQRAVAQAETMVGGRCLSELGSYDGNKTLKDFSKAAEKAGMDTYKIEGAEQAVFHALRSAMCDDRVHTSQYNTYLLHNEEFRNTYEKEAEKYTEEAMDLSNSGSYSWAYSAAVNERLQYIDNENKEMANHLNFSDRADTWEASVDDFSKRGLDGNEETAVSKKDGIAVLTALLVKKDNPEATFKDILDYRTQAPALKEQKDAATARILEAYAEVKTNPEKLGSVIADAAKAYSEINIRREVKQFSADGAEFRDPSKRAEFIGNMAAVAEYCVNADYVINSAVKGRGAWLPFTADTGKDDSDIAKAVYESARNQMSFEDQRKYQNAAFNKYQQEMVLNTFTDCKQRMTDFENYDKKDGALFASADKAVSVIMKTDKSLHDFPLEAAFEIEKTRRAAKGSKALAQYDDTDIIMEGIEENHKAKIEERAANMNTEPKKPDKLNMWVRFWSKLGFYKDTVKEHNAAVAGYEAYLKNEEARKEAGDFVDQKEQAAVRKISLTNLQNGVNAARGVSKAAESHTQAVKHKEPEIKSPGK